MTRRVWWTVLTVVSACGYLWIGVTTPLPAIRWPALGGGLLVLAALGQAARHRRIAVAVLVVGALAPVVTGWWSLVIPLTALLIVLCGVVAVRSSEPAGHEQPGHQPRSYRLGPVRRALNAVTSVLLGWGVGPASSYLLTTTGRTTGRLRTTPVTLVETMGHRWLVSPYGQVGWVRNVRATPEASLRRGRTILAIHALEVDAADAGPVLRRYVGQVPVTAPFFAATAGDPVEDFVAEAPRHPVFALSETSSP